MAMEARARQRNICIGVGSLGQLKIQRHRERSSMALRWWGGGSGEQPTQGLVICTKVWLRVPAMAMEACTKLLNIWIGVWSPGQLKIQRQRERSSMAVRRWGARLR